MSFSCLPTSLRCNKKNYLYCPDCLVPFTAVPSVSLPCSVSVLMHHLEKRKTNTGIQLALICPTQVDVHGLNDFPEGFDASRTVILVRKKETYKFKSYFFSISWHSLLETLRENF